jgi:tRNA(fMet)-specific endonuclease VapC
LVLDYDHDSAKEFGKMRGTLLQHGISVPTADLMIAAIPLVHNLTLVTNNTGDFQNIPGLRLDDWVTP